MFSFLQFKNNFNFGFVFECLRKSAITEINPKTSLFGKLPRTYTCQNFFRGKFRLKFVNDKQSKLSNLMLFFPHNNSAVIK